MTNIPVANQTFWQQVQMPYLKKGRLFSDFLLFLKCARNLEPEEKEEYPSLIITEIIAFERDVYLSV